MPETTACATCGGELIESELEAGIHAVCGPPDRPCWPDGRAVEVGDQCRVAMGPPGIAGRVGVVVEVNGNPTSVPIGDAVEDVRAHQTVAVALEDSRAVRLTMPEIQRWSARSSQGAADTRVSAAETER